jgi:3-methyladenine DNA glycosylase AlkD
MSRSVTDVESAIAWLRAHSTPATLQGMARYGIPSGNALGVAVKDIKALGKQLGKDQKLASGLWRSGVYEARMLASFVGDPTQITAAEMDRWCDEFDNWGICDTICFNLFDRTPHAWDKVEQWSKRDEEFVKRAAFALLWSLTVHDKKASDLPFIQGLARIEEAANDERHYVKKAVNMALRAVGKRNSALRAAAIRVSRSLAESDDPSARWIGKDALRELEKKTR